MTQNNAPKWHSLVTGTADQIAALKSEARLTVVSAGAGTGKTQTLSQRFAWLLASDPSCGAGEILVLTFTKKAAPIPTSWRTLASAWSTWTTPTSRRYTPSR